MCSRLQSVLVSLVNRESFHSLFPYFNSLHILFMMVPEMAGRQLFCVVPPCEHVGTCSLESHYTCLRLKVLTYKKSFVKLAKISWRCRVKQSFLSFGGWGVG